MTRRTSLGFTCPICGSEFSAQPCEIQRGRGKFCSPECYWQSLNQPRDTLFWKRVNKQESCWLWTAGTNNKGYGVFTTSRKFKQLAHRFSYELHHSVTLTRAQKVLHHCDNPPCVNPAHLFVGTQKDNMQDCIQKGRRRQGTIVNGQKLNPDRVRAIRSGFADGLSYDELATIHNVHSTMIGYVVTRKCWKYVT